MYTFKFDPVSGELNATKNPNFIPGFFSIGNSVGNKGLLRNTTAIAGENGAGKSSLLYFIKDFVSSEFNITNSAFFVILLGTENDIQIYSNGIVIKETKDTQDLIKPISELPKEQLGLVYYSSIFDHHKGFANYGNLINDISTSYLFQKDFNKHREEVGGLYPRDLLGVHHMKEIERQVNFISSNKRSHFKDDFRLPEELTISFSPIADTENVIKQLSRYKISNIVSKILTYLKQSEGRKFESDEHRFMWRLTFRAIEHLMHEVEGTSFLLKIDRVIKNAFFHINKDRHPLDNVLAWLLKIVYYLKQKNSDEFGDKGQRDFEYAVDIVEGITKTLIIVDKLIWGRRVAIKNDSLIISLVEDSSAFMELQHWYKKSTKRYSLLKFDWRNLSSGEKAMLNLYARFYSLTESRSKLNKNLIILIDEGELYLHPQWQKRFLKSILEFLEALFYDLGIESIQVILASNSPFIVSDLPSSHIIFIKKDKDSTVVLDSLEDQYQTFAANIHTLLSHSFFLQDGLIGEFAKDKINWVIRLLLSDAEETVNENMNMINYIIKNIGEPILKTKITSMLQERQGSTSEIITRISLLEKEVQKLKQELKEND